MALSEQQTARQAAIITAVRSQDGGSESQGVFSNTNSRYNRGNSELDVSVALHNFEQDIADKISAQLHKDNLDRAKGNEVGESFNAFEDEETTKFFKNSLERMVGDVQGMSAKALNIQIERMQHIMSSIDETSSSEAEFLQEQYAKSIVFMQDEFKRKNNIALKSMNFMAETAEQYLNLESLYSGFVNHNPIAMGLFKLGANAVRSFRTNKKAKEDLMAQDQARASEAFRIERDREITEAQEAHRAQEIQDLEEANATGNSGGEGLSAREQAIQDEENEGGDGSCDCFEQVIKDAQGDYFTREAPERDSIGTLLDNEDEEEDRATDNFRKETKAREIKLFKKVSEIKDLLVDGGIGGKEEEEESQSLLGRLAKMFAFGRILKVLASFKGSLGALVKAIGGLLAGFGLGDAIGDFGEDIDVDKDDKKKSKKDAKKKSKAKSKRKGKVGRGTGFANSYKDKSPLEKAKEKFKKFKKPSMGGVGRAVSGAGSRIGGVLSGAGRMLGGSLLGGAGATTATAGATAGAGAGMGAMALPALALAGAGATGYGIGSLIYDNVLGDDSKDLIGEGITRTLAFFGNDEAQSTLDSNEKFEQMKKAEKLKKDRSNFDTDKVLGKHGKKPRPKSKNAKPPKEIVDTFAMQEKANKELGKQFENNEGFMDLTGEGTAKTLAFFGNDEAQASIDSNEKSEKIKKEEKLTEARSHFDMDAILKRSAEQSKPKPVANVLDANENAETLNGLSKKTVNGIVSRKLNGEQFDEEKFKKLGLKKTVTDSMADGDIPIHDVSDEQGLPAWFTNTAEEDKKLERISQTGLETEVFRGVDTGEFHNKLAEKDSMGAFSDPDEINNTRQQDANKKYLELQDMGAPQKLIEKELGDFYLSAKSANTKQAINPLELNKGINEESGTFEKISDAPNRDQLLNKEPNEQFEKADSGTPKIKDVNFGIAMENSKIDNLEMPESALGGLMGSVSGMKDGMDAGGGGEAMPQPVSSGTQAKVQPILGSGGGKSSVVSARNPDSSIQRLTDRFQGFGMA